MGYGTFLAMRCNFISQSQMERIVKLISDFELSFQEVETSIQEYKALCESLPRRGLGVDAHCRDVGLEDPSKVDSSKPEDTIRDLRAENARLRAKLKLAGLSCACCSEEGENVEAFAEE